MKYAEVEVRVAGIPAIARVYGFSHEAESWSSWDGGSPASYSFNYYLYDRKGYRAEWLDRKVTESVDEQICDQIVGELG